MQQTNMFLIQSEDIELPIHTESVQKRYDVEIPPHDRTGTDWPGKIKPAERRGRAENHHASSPNAHLGIFLQLNDWVHQRFHLFERGLFEQELFVSRTSRSFQLNGIRQSLRALMKRREGDGDTWARRLA